MELLMTSCLSVVSSFPLLFPNRTSLHPFISEKKIFFTFSIIFDWERTVAKVLQLTLPCSTSACPHPRILRNGVLHFLYTIQSSMVMP